MSDPVILPNLEGFFIAGPATASYYTDDFEIQLVRYPNGRDEFTIVAEPGRARAALERALALYTKADDPR